MKIYDNKGVLAVVARILGLRSQKILLEKVTRLLAETGGDKPREELTKTLPAIPL
jgi:hypothetical protein